MVSNSTPFTRRVLNYFPSLPAYKKTREVGARRLWPLPRLSAPNFRLKVFPNRLSSKILTIPDYGYLHAKFVVRFFSGVGKVVFVHFD